MNIADHVALAEWLLRHAHRPLSRAAALGVLVGSALPDCNPFTYLSGVPCHQGLHGHNAEVREKTIGRLLRRVRRGNVGGFFAGVRLGIALHYLADAFTYPHHAYYPGTLRDHLAYERELHREMAAHLPGAEMTPVLPSGDPMAYAADMLRFYRHCPPSERTDCRFITTVCRVVFDSVTTVAESEVAVCENPHHDGLVSACR